MRLNFTLSALVLGMAVLCISCSKSAVQREILLPSAPSPHVVNEVKADVTPDGLYELYLSAENVQIHKQATHFELSLIGDDGKNGLVRYKYVPAKGFTGSDEVTLSETKISSSYGGDCNNGGADMVSTTQKTTKFTKISFTVK